MATKSSSKDTYANIAAVNVVEPGINTQTTVKFQFPFSIMDKMGLIINRIEYWTAPLGGFAAAGDRLYLGLSAAAVIANPSIQNDPLMIDSCIFNLGFWGAAANAQIINGPYVKDFSDLPGGGILVAPNPLYGLAQGVSLTAITDSWIKLYYTYIQMNTDEYWQLVESRRIISS